jgi:hypothetical protein
VLTFAATGQGPFGEGRTEALAFRVVYNEPMLDGLPAPLREIVARCLAKDPRYRPGPGEVIAALGAVPADGPAAGEGWLPEPVERLVGLHQAVETAAMAASPATGPRLPADDSATPTRTTRGTELPGPGPAAGRPRGWVLAAFAVGVLAVGGAVASKLLATTPAPPATSAGLVADSPTGASRPASPATPSLPSSATPSGPATRSGPAAVVQAYYAAINNHDCGRAWSLGGDNLSAAQGQTYQQFCQGFSTTSHDTLTVESVAGHTVTVTIVAEQADGTSQTYRGSYVVGNGVIDSASVRAATSS